MLVRSYTDDKKINWSIIESNSEHFKIQIEFEPEDLVSETPLVAHLHITFWGTDFFRSMRDGVKVRLGTTLNYPIFN